MSVNVLTCPSRNNTSLRTAWANDRVKISICDDGNNRNLDSCYRVIKSFRIWLTSSYHQIYHLMFKNKTDHVATISTWIWDCYIEHWRKYCSTRPLHCFMIASFHQLNAYVQIAQIPSNPSKRLSRRLVCFKLRFPFGISSAWLPRFMVCFLLLFLCEFIIKHPSGAVLHGAVDKETRMRQAWRRGLPNVKKQ